VTLIDVNIKLKRNLETATNLNQEISQKASKAIDKSKTIYLSGRNKNETFSTLEENIFFICSEGNYVQIKYKDQAVIKQKMIRNTLNNINDQLKNIDSIVQCHRAYLVNTAKIVNAQGNAQGFRLKLKDIDETIPVSRKYVPMVKESLAL
jgi:DNA-binding LytR/AlgR family response regulator